MNEESEQGSGGGSKVDVWTLGISSKNLSHLIHEIE